MFEFMKRLAGSAPSNPLLVGTWVTVGGDLSEPVEYRKDGTVRMAMFGGIVHMSGRYHFIKRDTIQIDWHIEADPSADAVFDHVNRELAANGESVRARVLRQSVLQIEVTESELKTLHVEKGRRGHLRRVDTVASA